MRVWRFLRSVLSGVGAVIRDFLHDDALAHAATIAFYALLSLAPLLVVVLAIAGAIWGPEAARGEIVAQFGELMGRDAAGTIEEIIERASAQPTRGTIASLFGLVVLLIGAIGVFGRVKVALNTIWEVEPRPGRGLWGFLRDRLLSFAMVMCIAFLLLLSLTMSAALAAASGWISRSIDLPPWLLWVASALLTLVILSLLFAAMFKILPDVRLAWRDAWIGALVTAVLFTVGKHLIGLYLGRSTALSVYGAAGSLVLILLWVYYSSMIFLFGAELTQVYARWRGSAIEPSRHARWRDDACKAQRVSR